MLTGLFASTTALQSFQTALDTTANNLANIATNGFKSRRVLFQDLIYFGPVNQQIGYGSRVGTIDRDFNQGQSTLTGSEFDVAIDGPGFFSVLSPKGEVQYSRDGAFHIDQAGRLLSSSGLPLQPPITLPSDTTALTIATNGVVSVLTSSSPLTPTVLGQLQLSKFINPQGLADVGGNRYVETDESGTPQTSTPGSIGFGTVNQGRLELSNVNTADEMVKLVNTSRNYVSNSRALRTEDQILQGALDLIG